MKKFFYIAFIVALLNSTIIPAKDIKISSGSFDLVLIRPGVTDYYFTSAGSDNRLSEEVTFSLVSDESLSATAFLGFTCHIYDPGTFNVDLIFASSTENYGNSTTEDFMLRHKEFKDIGLNYSVKVYERADGSSDNRKEVGSLNFKDASDGSNSVISSKLIEGSRTLRLINGGKVTASSGISKSFDIELTLNAPTRRFNNEEDPVTGFSAGQYEGEIVVNVTTTS